MATVAPEGENKMAETAIMAEEMQSPKKVAFANRKYTTKKNAKWKKKNLSKCLKNNVVK